MTITVDKLPSPIRAGDYKDPPLKWTVKGPGIEVQNFATKQWATRYASVRRSCESQGDAISKFVRFRMCS